MLSTIKRRAIKQGVPVSGEEDNNSMCKRPKARTCMA